MLLITLAFAADLPALEHGQCERLQGKRAQLYPGADQYYQGEYTIKGTEFIGTETRLLYANSTWKSGSKGKVGKDCKVVWKIKGMKELCPRCAFRVVFHAMVDREASTCELDLVHESPSWKGSYDVQTTDKGTVELFMTRSHQSLGSGTLSDTALSWTSNHRCVWF